MKKIVWTLAVLAASVLQLQAQTRDDGTGFRFGFQFSPTFARLGTSDKLIEATGTNTGAKLGVMAENFFARNYAITTGLGFGFNQGGTIQNGYDLGVFWAKSDLSSRKLDTLPQNAKLRYSATFVEIPIGLKMRGGSNEDARFKFYAEAPVFTFGFLSKVRGDIRGTNTQNSEDENIRQSVNGVALSWGLGGGIEYEIATVTHLVLGVFYQKQITDFTDNGGTVRTADKIWKAEKSKGTVGMLGVRAGVFF